MAQEKTVTVALRPASMVDVGALVELFNAETQALFGKDEITEQELTQEWQTPGFDPAANVRLVEGDDGQIVGFVDYWNTTAPFVRPHVWVSVHPDVKGNGLAPKLLDWAEARARQDISKAPEDARIAMLAATHQADTTMMDLLGERLSEVRRFYHMHIEFDGQPPAPQTPEGFTIRPMREGEGRDAYRVVLASFKDHFGMVADAPFEERFARWSHFVLEDPSVDPDLLFVAEHDSGQLAGICICAPTHGTDKDMAWVHTLGVLREHRHRGLGEALLRHSFVAFERKGKQRAGLGVDAQSLTGATRLYEKCGMHVDRVYVQFEKELRPGVELATTDLEE